MRFFHEEDIMISANNVTYRIGKKALFEEVNIKFTEGNCYGLIGANGAGKSTFLNLLTGALTPDSGKIIVGDTIKFGYYTQEGIEVLQGQKVIEVIQKYGDYIPLLKGRTLSAGQLLERFLFDRKKQYDYVEKLSGGELKRLYLCTVLIQNPNFLILDEPTNDLDIVTLNVLEDFLLDYPGCLVVVSHDRYFMDKIVDHLFVFRGQGEVEDFPGNYTDYRVYEESTPPPDDVPKKETTKNTWRKDANKGLSFNEQKEYNRLEKEIAQLEEKKTAIEAAFAEGNLTNDEIQSQSVALQETLVALEEKTERWFELTERLDN